MSRGYLGEHPDIYRKVNDSSQRFTNSLQSVDISAMTEEFIAEEKDRIYDLEMRIKAYEIKVKEERGINLDHSEEIEALESEAKKSRAEEAQILQQIQNCRKVENQVAPMQYYLWKKKQRINTYDASIAQLCREVEQQREYLERSIEEHRRLNEQLLTEIEELEERIANFHSSPRQSQLPVELEEQEFEELFGQNIKLKQEYSVQERNYAFLEQNIEIVGAQVVDNIDSMVTTIKSIYEDEKTRLVREFKQLQVEARTSEISPLTREEISYSVEPLLNDYSHKLAEMQAAAPEEVRKYIQPVLQPLPWKSFNWVEFLQMNSSSESIYDEYTRLEKQFIATQKEIEPLQAELRRINSEVANEQQKSNEILMNISKLKKKLEK